MNNYAFLITSALNTKFGVFSKDQRLEQTLATIESIKQKIPSAKVVLLEMGAISLTDIQRTTLLQQVDRMIEFSSDTSVQNLYHSTDNWDIVKNVTEVTCFANAMRQLQSENYLDDVQRIFKISGRYKLTKDFDINLYNTSQYQDMIVLSKSRNSQFSSKLTGGITQQFMSRLWSWPVNLNEEIIAAYDQFLAYMFERIQAGGYADVEHTLYKFLDHTKILQVDRVGIAGRIGPNGLAVED